MARMGIPPSMVPLAIGPPQMKMLDPVRRHPRPRPLPPPVRFCPGPGSGAATRAAPASPPASPPAAGWGPRIEEVVKREEIGALSAPLEGWPQHEQFWPTAAGRRIIADPIFQDGHGSTPLQQTRSDSDILTRAPTLSGAECVPSEEFWPLNKVGESVAAPRGRDFAARALQQRPARAYRH